MTVTLPVPTSLVVGTRTELRLVICGELERGHDVDLDLSACGYVDSAGLGMLLRLSREARERGRRIRLTGISAECREYFAAAKLLEVLELVPPSQFPIT